MSVPRGTQVRKLETVKSRPLTVRKDVADGFLANITRTLRVCVTHENSLVSPGSFAGVDLESGRQRDGTLRARCSFEAGTRAVTISSKIKAGDLFWVRADARGRDESTLTVEVLDVDVSRLQDMTDQDALAAGAALFANKFKTSGTPRQWFAAHWDSLARGTRRAPNLRATWIQNPWVWTYHLKTYHRSIDYLLRERNAERNP